MSVFVQCSMGALFSVLHPIVRMAAILEGDLKMAGLFTNDPWSQSKDRASLRGVFSDIYMR